MRRLITSRGVWLGLSAALVAAVVVLIVRARRRPAGRPDGAAPGTPPPAGGEAPASWPPVPVLGVPAAEDLRRYATAEPAGHPLLVRFLGGEARKPREPLDAATRRGLTRWGAAGLALLLLTAGTHALESMVFSQGTGSEAHGRAVTVTHPPRLVIERCDGTAQERPERCPLPSAEPGPPDEGAPSRIIEVAEPRPRTQTPSPDADCRPGSGAPRVRKPGQKTVRAVNRQWRRIEAWLRENAPRSHRTLGGPARPEAIAAAEARMGLRFPGDLRASLLRHDGTLPVGGVTGFGFLGNRNMSVREIQDTWRMMCGIDGTEEGPGDPREEWWDGRMIPFGDDGSGNNLVIDSVEGDVGDADHENGMSFTPGGVPVRSYYALLKVTADALEKGGSIGYWKPVAVAGELYWEIL